VREGHAICLCPPPSFLFSAFTVGAFYFTAGAIAPLFTLRNGLELKVTRTKGGSFVRYGTYARYTRTSSLCTFFDLLVVCIVKCCLCRISDEKNVCIFYECLLTYSCHFQKCSSRPTKYAPGCSGLLSGGFLSGWPFDRWPRVRVAFSPGLPGVAWDASRPTFENAGTMCIWSSPTSARLAVISAGVSAFQRMADVHRRPYMTEFPLQKTRRGGCARTEWGVNVYVAAYRASGAFTSCACFVDYAFVIVVIERILLLLLLLLNCA